MRTTLVVAVAASALLAVTNPRQADYVAWVQSKLQAGQSHSFGQALENAVAGPIISLSTSRENYLLFSKFTTNLDPSHMMTAIGLLSMFFVVKSQGVVSDTQIPTEAGKQTTQPTPPQARHQSNVCFHESAGHLVIARQMVLLPRKTGDSHAHFDSFQAIVSARVDRSKSGDFEFVGASEFNFYRPNTDCAPAFSETMNGFDGGRVEVTDLNGQGVVHLVAVSSGGSGMSYKHLVLLPGSNGLNSITPFDLTHSNMGGFFVGDLGGERGPGIAIWDAIWTTGAHYSPHPYTINFYRWTGSSFLPPETASTTETFLPEPDELPTKMSWPFRDITTRGDFTRVVP